VRRHAVGRRWAHQGASSPPRKSDCSGRLARSTVATMDEQKATLKRYLTSLHEAVLWKVD
jgi:hypothetical protein